MVRESGSNAGNPKKCGKKERNRETPQGWARRRPARCAEVPMSLGSAHTIDLGDQGSRLCRVRLRKPDGPQTDKRGFKRKAVAEVFGIVAEGLKSRREYVDLSAVEFRYPPPKPPTQLAYRTGPNPLWFPGDLRSSSQERYPFCRFLSEQDFRNCRDYSVVDGSESLAARVSELGEAR